MTFPKQILKLVSCNNLIYTQKLIIILTDIKEEPRVQNHVRRTREVLENPKLQDKYYTSEEAYLAMRETFLKVFGEGAIVWDPCAGHNTPLANGLRQDGYTVIENDLYASDGSGKDFLTMAIPEGVTGIISNFPYSQVSYYYIIVCKI